MRPASFSPAALERELGKLVPGWPNGRLLVALSGGVDSVVLLAALAQLRRKGLALRALYVDHGLLPQSPAWGRFCRRFASGLGVSCGVRRARIPRLRGASLEARARDERYRLLSAALRPGETLVTAQHEDDQAETLLLQLLRGAGIAGLAAMPASMPIGRRTLVRPLLGFPRAALEDWARMQGLAWVDDESNADERFDRNFLRRQILPRLRERWPAAPRTIARAAANLAAAKSLLADLADLDLAGIQAGETLAVAGLRHLGADRQRNAVRRWLEARGLPRPERAQLERIVGEL
ncbi:MAG: tRNA lysidine(34) synthetase TilS, partial [Steroidobacteraceae bacterium]